MAWKELSISVPHEYVEPVSYLFGRYGKGLSTEPQGKGMVMLRTYLPAESRQRLARIEVGVRLVRSIEPMGDLVVRELSDDEDWQNAWKSYFEVLRVGRRLVIKPSWLELDQSLEIADPVVIELDPGIAFGTGYHPTTYTCLEALEDLVRPGMTVLDLGSGSGILTIAAVKLGAERVVALDIDAQAVSAARQNFRRLHLQKQVALARGSVPHPSAGDGAIDLAVANISARGVADRAPFILRVLQPGALFVASGLLAAQRPEVEDALLPLGFTHLRDYPRDEWITLIYSAPFDPPEPVANMAWERENLTSPPLGD
jgi:ribosomal protein L11 methyltransferase